MNSHEQSRTGIPVLDRLGDNFDLVLRAIDEREAAANVVAMPARPRRARMAGMLAAAATLVVAVAVLAHTLLTGGALTTEQAIADVAQAASVQTLPPDDAYTFTRSRIVESQRVTRPPSAAGAGETPIAFLVTSERQSWLSIAREGLVQIHRLDVTFANKADERAARPLMHLGSGATTFRYPAIGAYRIGDRTDTRNEIEAFPTDPRSIYDKLNAEVQTANEADHELAMWNALTDPLTSASAPLPIDLRAGLVGAIGLLPGVKAAGDVQTPRGQTGIGFSLGANGAEEKIIFDKDTSAVLYKQSKIVDPQTAEQDGVPPGTTVDSYELLDQQVVANLPPTTR